VFENFQKISSKKSKFSFFSKVSKKSKFLFLSSSNLDQEWGCVILREIDSLLKIYWSIVCIPPSIFCIPHCGYFLPLSLISQTLVAWASAEIFPGEEHGRDFAYLFLVVGDACIANWRIQKRKCRMWRQQLHTVFSLKETLHWANFCFSEHGYCKTE